jgi:peptidoglycan/LPS O-acetylase OafA/YrhL
LSGDAVPIASPDGEPRLRRFGRWLHGLYFQRATSYHVQWDSLDGVRGFAAFFVIFGHSSNRGAHLAPFLNFNGAGTYGIFLFFALSAFLLTYPLLSLPPAELGSPLRWGRYVLRRVLRIYPLFVAVLLVSYAIHAAELSFAPLWYPITDAEVLWKHLTLRSAVFLFWSIVVEFKYYMIMPAVVLMYVVVLRNRTSWGLAFGAASIVLASLYGGTDVPSLEQRSWLQPFLVCFMAGSMAAFVHWKLTLAGGVTSLRIQAALDVIAIGCVVWVFVLFPANWSAITGTEISARHFQAHRTFFSILWTVFILCVLNGRGWLRRVFSWKPLRFVGIVSFSTYLLHLPLHFQLTFYSDVPLQYKAPLLFVLSLLAASVSFPLIERPFTQSRWVRRLTRSAPRAQST